MIFASLGRKGGTSSTTTVDIGTGPNQIPNNTIVQNKLNTYSILEKAPGVQDPQIPDNARVKSLIGTAVETINTTIEAINDVTDQIQTDVDALKNNPPPTKIGYQLICSENIIAGKYVNIWIDNGVSKLRLANASNGRLVDGYVDVSFTTGSLATFYKEGKNVNGNICPHGPLYLSTTISGDATTDRPADRSGHWLQEIGTCVADGIHIFELGLKIQLT